MTKQEANKHISELIDQSIALMNEAAQCAAEHKLSFNFDHCGIEMGFDGGVHLDSEEYVESLERFNKSEDKVARECSIGWWLPSSLMC